MINAMFGKNIIKLVIIKEYRQRSILINSRLYFDKSKYNREFPMFNYLTIHYGDKYYCYL